MRFRYLALLLSSNLTPCACRDHGEPLESQRDFDQPRILSSGPKPSAAATGTPRPDVPSGDPLAYCAHGLEPSSDPKLDVTRLGVLCGPSSGLEPAEEAIVTRLGARTVERRYTVTRPGCVRVALSVGTNATPLEVEWLSDSEVLARCDVSHFGWCPVDEALCLDADGVVDEELSLNVKSLGEDVTLSARVWKREKRKD